MNLNYYHDQFDMIKQCKDPDIRDRQLGILMTNMEFDYDIPVLKDEVYIKANPNVMELYQIVSNARGEEL